MFELYVDFIEVTTGADGREKRQKYQARRSTQLNELESEPRLGRFLVFKRRIDSAGSRILQVREVLSGEPAIVTAVAIEPFGETQPHLMYSVIPEKNIKALRAYLTTTCGFSISKG